MDWKMTRRQFLGLLVIMAAYVVLRPLMAGAEAIAAYAASQRAEVLAAQEVAGQVKKVFGLLAVDLGFISCPRQRWAEYQTQMEKVAARLADWAGEWNPAVLGVGFPVMRRRYVMPPQLKETA